MKHRADSRIAEILAMIQRVARGDLHGRINTSEAKDDLDAIAEGLNMLAEEIDASTVSISRFRKHLESGGNFKSHPIFGRLTRDQWDQFHTIHCMHHLSFLTPAS